MDVVNIAVPCEVLNGLGLIVGRCTRLAAFWGAFIMLLFYLGSWETSNGYSSGDLASMLVFLAVAAVDAGHILGLDRCIEQTRSATSRSSSGTPGCATPRDSYGDRSPRSRPAFSSDSTSNPSFS